MGLIGMLLIIMAVGQIGFTCAGVAIGVAGVALTGLGFRFGFCPACTVSCVI